MKNVLAKRFVILTIMIIALLGLPLCGLAADYTYKSGLTFHQNNDMLVAMLQDAPDSYAGCPEFQTDWNGDGVLNAADYNDYITVEWTTTAGSITSKEGFSDGVWPDGTISIGNPHIYLSGLKPEDDGQTATMKLTTPNGDTYTATFTLRYTGIVKRTPIFTTDDENFTCTAGKNRYDLTVTDGATVSVDITDYYDGSNYAVSTVKFKLYEIDPATEEQTLIGEEYIDTNTSSTEDDEFTFTASADNQKNYRWRYDLYSANGGIQGNFSTLLNVEVLPKEYPVRFETPAVVQGGKNATVTEADEAAAADYILNALAGTEVTIDAICDLNATKEYVWRFYDEESGYYGSGITAAKNYATFTLNADHDGDILLVEVKSEDGKYSGSITILMNVTAYEWNGFAVEVLNGEYYTETVDGEHYLYAELGSDITVTAQYACTDEIDRTKTAWHVWKDSEEKWKTTTNVPDTYSFTFEDEGRLNFSINENGTYPINEVLWLKEYSVVIPTLSVSVETAPAAANGVITVTEGDTVTITAKPVCSDPSIEIGFWWMLETFGDTYSGETLECTTATYSFTATQEHNGKTVSVMATVPSDLEQKPEGIGPTGYGFELVVLPKAASTPTPTLEPTATPAPTVTPVPAPTPTVEVKVEEQTEEQKQNQTVTVVIPDDTVEEAIQNAQSNVVVFPVDQAPVEEELSVTTAKASVSAFEELAESNKAVSITMSHAEVVMQPEVIEQIAASADDGSEIEICVEQKETEEALTAVQQKALADQKVAAVITADVFMKEGNTRTKIDFNGKVTLKVPFTPPVGESGHDYVIVFVADNGQTEVMPTYYTNGQLVFETSHFSDFVITTRTVNPTVSESVPQTGDNATPYLWMLGMAIAAIGCAVLVGKRRQHN